jgi:hypothetical protein
MADPSMADKNERSSAGTSDNTDFELTGRAFSKMSIRRCRLIHGVESKKLIHVVIAPTLVRQAL